MSSVIISELKKLNTSKAGKIILSWSGTSNATGYQIERSAGGKGFTTIASVGSGVTSYTDSSVRSSIVYSYRVRAKTAAGAGELSNIRTGSPRPALVIRAPSRLVASTRFSDRVQIQWNDRSNNETSFVLERSIDGKNFAVLASLKRNTTAFNDGQVLDATRYFYRVRAVRKLDSSPFSNKDSATTRPLDGEIGYWNFEEGSGGTARDASGHSRDGTILGEVTFSDGKVGQNALSFHGVGSAISHVQISDERALRFSASDSFALSAWVRPTTVPSNLQAIVSKSGKTGSFYGLFINPNGQFEFDGISRGFTGHWLANLEKRFETRLYFAGYDSNLFLDQTHGPDKLHRNSCHKILDGLLSPILQLSLNVDLVFREGVGELQ